MKRTLAFVILTVFICSLSVLDVPTKEALTIKSSKKTVSKIKKTPANSKNGKFVKSKEQVRQKVLLNDVKKSNTLIMDSKNMPPKDPRDITPTTQF